MKLFISLFIAQTFGAQVIDIGKNDVNGKGYGPNLNIIESTTLKPEIAIRYLEEKIRQMEKKLLTKKKGR